MLKEDIPFKNYDHAAKMAAGYHFTIDRDGYWYCHDPAMGLGPIKNERISGLFAGAGSGKYAGKGMSRDRAGKYWLKAPPDDVYGIDVEDVPFVVTSYVIENNRLTLMTNFAEKTTLNAHKTFTLRKGVPYVEIRDGLMARLSRNVFYQLADIAVEKNGRLGLEIDGVWHEIGAVS